MKYLSIGLILVLAFFVVSCGKNQKLTRSPDLASGSQTVPSPSQDTTATSVPIGIQMGQRAPDFTLKTITGESFKLSDQRGKPVFLNFWATWCGPCRVEMPDMEKLQQAMGDSILIVGIDLREPLSTVQNFLRDHSFTWTFVLDSNGAVATEYEVAAIPTSIFIDAKGVIVRKFRGTRSYATFLEAAQQAINN